MGGALFSPKHVSSEENNRTNCQSEYLEVLQACSWGCQLACVTPPMKFKYFAVLLDLHLSKLLRRNHLSNGRY